MKVYALLYTTGQFPGFDCTVFAVTHAGSLEMACRKFRVTPIEQYGKEAVRRRLPLPPKAEHPEFTQVKATEASGSELGHVLSIPAHFGHMINVGSWVCELPVID